MDPQYEQSLRDEVIYLHYLWHQGPPRPYSPAAATIRNLQPSNETHFKKQIKRKSKRGKRFNYEIPESNSSPGIEWPIPSPPPQPTTGWACLAAKPDPKPYSPSPEEQLKFASKHAHKRALKVVHDFFRSNDDDDDAIGSSSDDDDDDDELMEEEDGREEYSFFFKVFKEDTELSEYYVKNYANGEFTCLVCGAVGGKNTGKKFTGCLALVQHSITIANTKKRRAHRAFGQAVCKVLDWDIDRLPAIVSSLSNNNSGETQGNPVEGNNGKAVPESSNQGDMNTLMCPDADKNLENLGTTHSRIAEEHEAEALTSVNVDKNIVHPCAGEALTSVSFDKNLDNSLHKAEEPAAEMLKSVSVDKNLENLEKVEEPTSTSAHVNNNVENLCTVHPKKVEEPGMEEALTNQNVSVDGHPHIMMDTTASTCLTCPVSVSDNNSDNLEAAHPWG